MRSCWPESASGLVRSAERLTLGGVPPESVALIPECVECGDRWLPADEERWQAHWIDDGRDEVLVFYGAECGEWEFRSE